MLDDDGDRMEPYGSVPEPLPAPPLPNEYRDFHGLQGECDLRRPCSTVDQPPLSTPHLLCCMKVGLRSTFESLAHTQPTSPLAFDYPPTSEPFLTLADNPHLALSLNLFSFKLV